eukprot:15173454-Alexandrium_andersonii.AAC.1
MRLHRGVMKQCALLNKHHDDEWTVKVIDRDEAVAKTVVDSGRHQLRHGQLEAKVKKLRATIQTTVTAAERSTALLDADD